MANSEFDPMDEEEREIMEAIERGDTQPVPIEELERIRAEIRGSAHNITIRMKDADIRAPLPYRRHHHQRGFLRQTKPTWVCRSSQAFRGGLPRIRCVSCG